MRQIKSFPSILTSIPHFIKRYFLIKNSIIIPIYEIILSTYYKLKPNIKKKRSNRITPEESINKIKLIKRIVYGYRNFQNYKYRILLSFKNK
ncbi:transposase [Vagococcus teuberi]|uniref:transposase n=1 Tax=Vagococcus teuberi TaxID=519472 RepID=UPI001B804EFE